MDENAKQLLTDAKSWAIIIPDNPTFDEVAAALTLQLAFSSTKSVTVYSSNPMRVEFNRLVGVDKVQNTLGNKNLLLKFPGYDARNIERVSYDIDDKDNVLSLTVVPNPGQTAPTQDQINVSYTGLDAQIVILLGGDKITDFKVLDAQELQDKNKLHFGVVNLQGLLRPDVVVAIGSFSTVSEYVYDYLIQNNIEISLDMANNLVAGIDMGTNFLALPSLTAKTFDVFSTLLKQGATRHIPEQIANPQKAMQQMQQMQQMGQMPGYPAATQYPQQGFNPNMTTQMGMPPAPSNLQMPPAPASSQQPVVHNPQSKESAATDETETKSEGEVPKEWTQPKVYKGTPIN